MCLDKVITVKNCINSAIGFHLCAVMALISFKVYTLSRDKLICDIMRKFTLFLKKKVLPSVEVNVQDAKLHHLSIHFSYLYRMNIIANDADTGLPLN